MLTAKQEKFVRNLIKGMSQREAYKNAYNAENMTDESIDVSACRLFAEDKIKLRYKELQEKLDKATIMTAQERLEYLTGLVQETEHEHIIVIENGEIREVDRPADLNAKLKAIDIMNKMQSCYVQKVEADVKNEVTIYIELSDD